MQKETQKQKADKEIEKMENEEKILARTLNIWDALVGQRPRRGRWR